MRTCKITDKIKSYFIAPTNCHNDMRSRKIATYRWDKKIYSASIKRIGFVGRRGLCVNMSMGISLRKQTACLKIQKFSAKQ